MDVKVIQEVEVWDQALHTFSYPPFTQQWSWGLVQERLGKRVIRLMAEIEQGTILAQWIEERRGPLTYWFAPQGPVLPVGTSVQVLKQFLAEARAYLDGGIRVCFDRCEPRWRKIGDIVSLGEALLWPEARRVQALNPATSFVVPLVGTTEALLEQLHKKTRYNIRLAERHAVLVRGGTVKDVPILTQLLKETAERDEFMPHSQAYLQNVCVTLLESGQGHLRIAERNGKALAANFEVVCGDTVMYLYGASSSEDRDCMAPYALQWSAMFATLQTGYRWYDFGGGNPVDKTNPDFHASWEGMTRFKERWGTLRIQEAGTWDLPRQQLLYRLLVRR